MVLSLNIWKEIKKIKINFEDYLIFIQNPGNFKKIQSFISFCTQGEISHEIGEKPYNSNIKIPKTTQNNKLRRILNI